MLALILLFLSLLPDQLARPEEVDLFNFTVLNVD